MEPQFLSHAIRTENIPPQGIDSRLEADERQRAVIADALDLAGLDALSFDYRLRRSGRDRFRLSGRLEAVVIQNCVVTLEPVENALSVNVDQEFWPPGDIVALEQSENMDEKEIALDGPEPVEGSIIDVGQLVYETLASNLDPYPRKPGVAFTCERGSDEEVRGADSPFSVLRSLKSGNK
jgi:uncharacterized metal-binding protein YceD (DUF177 family)